jgi:hypothetical protein
VLCLLQVFICKDLELIWHADVHIVSFLVILCVNLSRFVLHDVLPPHKLQGVFLYLALRDPLNQLMRLSDGLPRRFNRILREFMHILHAFQHNEETFTQLIRC